MTDTKLLGTFAVDSGQVMIGDPCYLKDWKDNDYKAKRIYTNGEDTLEWGKDFNNYDHDIVQPFDKTMNQLLRDDGFEEVKTEPSREYSYDGACQSTCSDARGGTLGNTSFPQAVVSETGYGDGVYPVHATYNEEGRCIKLTITFE